MPSIQIHSTQPLHFTAICTSTGGFPANVTWTRDFETIDGGVTVFEDFRRYRHMLNSTQEGVYMCTISNDLPDIATATLNITSMLYTYLGKVKIVLPVLYYHCNRAFPTIQPECVPEWSGQCVSLLDTIRWC